MPGTELPAGTLAGSAGACSGWKENHLKAKDLAWPVLFSGGPHTPKGLRFNSQLRTVSGLQV